MGVPLVLILISNGGIFHDRNHPAIKGYPHDELETPTKWSFPPGSGVLLFLPACEMPW